MKKLINILMLALVVLSTTACFKDNKVIFPNTIVEFDDAVLRSSLPLVNDNVFPIYPSFPAIAVARTAGTQSARVNLVGAQRSTDQTIKVVFDAVATEAAVKSIRATSAASATITAAVAGTHFNIGNSGNVVIPANNSFGTASFDIINVAAATAPATSVVFVVRLEGTDDIKPSENFKRIAYRISLN